MPTPVITDPARGLLQAAIDASGEERWDALSILADWHEERGDPVAAGWREVVRLKRWPLNDGGTFVWFRMGRTRKHTYWGCEFLKGRVFRKLKQYSYPDWSDYDTKADALLDAAEAFAAEAREGKHG